MAASQFFFLFVFVYSFCTDKAFLNNVLFFPFFFSVFLPCAYIDIRTTLSLYKSCKVRIG